jgi:hypothetical protein
MSDTGRDKAPWALAVLLAAFLVAGVAAARLNQYSKAEPGFPDLSGAQIVEIRDARGKTVLSGEFRSRTDALGNIEMDAALRDRGGRRVIGEVEIEIPGPNSIVPEQELEIDIIEVEPNAKFSLYLDDREVTTFTTDDRGSIDIELHATPGPTGRR